MKTILSILLGSVCLCAQTISVQQPSVIGHASVPVLGYTLSGTTLRPVLGTAWHPSLGPELPVPNGVTAIYLPPRQNYALLRTASGLAITDLLAVARGEEFETRVKPIFPTLAGVSSVWFSPRGESAVISANGNLQLIAGLPDNPRVSNLGHRNVSSVAVSDDSQIVLASTPSSGIYAFAGGDWKGWSASAQPTAWSFVPGAHSLVVAGNSSLEIAENGDNPSGLKIIATITGDANRLYVGKDSGKALIQSAQGLNLADLQSGEVRQVAIGVDVNLVPLRDGDTFLTSTEPSIKLLRISAIGDGN